MTPLLLVAVTVVVVLATSRRRRAASARRSGAAALPDLASQLARSIRAGDTLRVALLDAARADGPLRDDLVRLRRDLERGSSLADALDRWRERSGTSDVALLVGACRLAHATGGSLAAALEGVAVTLVDRLEVAAEARALTTQATTSMWVLVALPPVAALCFASVDARVADVLTATPVGRVCLVVGSALDAFGAWVGRALVHRSVTG